MGVTGSDRAAEGSFFWGPIPSDPAFFKRLGERRAEIFKLDSENTDPRIQLTRPVTGVGQLDQRVVLAYGYRPRVGHRILQPGTWLVAGNRQNSFNLGVQRKDLRSRQVKGTARFIQMKSALPGSSQCVDNSVSVSQKE